MSVWAGATCDSANSSPFAYNTMLSVNVTDGSASAGCGGCVDLKKSIFCSVESRLRVFSCARIRAPALPTVALPPVWSPCQWVLIRVVTGLGEMAAMACAMSAERDVTPLSTCTMPSSPMRTAMLPPGPERTERLSVSLVILMGSVSKSRGERRRERGPCGSGQGRQRESGSGHGNAQMQRLAPRQHSVRNLVSFMLVSIMGDFLVFFLSSSFSLSFALQCSF